MTRTLKFELRSNAIIFLGEAVNRLAKTMPRTDDVPVSK